MKIRAKITILIAGIPPYELIKDRKIKTLHGLILRNTIEEQENKIRSAPASEEE